MTDGRKTKEGAAPEAEEPAGEGLLTSQDLFGDLLDEPAAPTAAAAPTQVAAPAPPKKARRKGPVKIKVKDPRLAEPEPPAPPPPPAPAARPKPRDVHVEFGERAAAPTRRTRRPQVPVALTPEADLAHTLLLERIRLLHHERRSGVLTLKNDDATKRIFMKRGRIVFASSTLEKDRFGEHLVRLGRISRAEFAAAYTVSRKSRRRLGQTLVQAGILDQDELGRMAALQVQKIVLSLFGWTAGEIRFEEDEEPIADDVVVDLSTHRLLFEGARIFPDVSRLEKALPPPERKLRVGTIVPFDYTKVPFSQAENAVLQDAADEKTVGDMLGRPLPRPLLVRAIYALLVGAILEEKTAAAALAALAAMEEDTGTFRLSPAATPPPEPEPLGLKEQLLQTYEMLPRATHYEVLGVPASATPQQIEAQYRKHVTQEEREWGKMKADLKLSSVLSTVKLRRREAYLCLSSADRRAEYDRSLAEPRATRAAASPAAHGKASRLIREARRFIEAGEKDRGISLLLEAIALDPKEPAGQRLLALQLASHPSLSKIAERHFLAALELVPDDVELRYALSQYYKQAGFPDRAVVQLRTLLSVQPDHEKARRDLNALQLTRR